MRVAIMGPVINEHSSGGVAAFSEGLFNGFIENEDECFLISLHKSKAIKNIYINDNAKPIKALFIKRKFAKILKQIKPNLVITSIHYSLGIKTYKRHWSKCKYVQVLHGVPWNINGKLKAWCVSTCAKYCKKHFDYTVTVSFLSYVLNKNMNSISCDKVINNGCIVDINENVNTNRNIDFIYIGRLFPDKGVEMIADAFVKLLDKNPTLNCCIGGYGELSYMFESGKYKDSRIKFLGKLSKEQVTTYMNNSKFFVSMCAMEAFGIAFVEAVFCGCNIVTQSTSGVAPLFIKKPYFHIADCVNSDELCVKLNSVLNQFINIGIGEMRNLKEVLSYKKVAQQYKKLLTNNKNS